MTPLEVEVDGEQYRIHVDNMRRGDPTTKIASPRLTKPRKPTPN